MKKYYIKYKINLKLKLINLNRYKNFITKYFLFISKLWSSKIIFYIFKIIL